MDAVKVRTYKQEDCYELMALFYQTVHEINKADYTKRQLEVWAPKEMDFNRWHARFSNSYTLVAVSEDKIVGFGNVEVNGYLDCLYVHKDYQRQGIASSIYEGLEKEVKDSSFIMTEASKTALLFFKSKGFRVQRAQKVIRQNIELENFKMYKIKKSET